MKKSAFVSLLGVVLVTAAAAFAAEKEVTGSKIELVKS